MQRKDIEEKAEQDIEEYKQKLEKKQAYQQALLLNLEETITVYLAIKDFQDQFFVILNNFENISNSISKASLMSKGFNEKLADSMLNTLKQDRTIKKVKNLLCDLYNAKVTENAKSTSTACSFLISYLLYNQHPLDIHKERILNALEEVSNINFTKYVKVSCEYDKFEEKRISDIVSNNSF